MGTSTRRRILVLLQLFEEKTDEQHTLTMPEIIAELNQYGIVADRRVIYEDIEQLSNMGREIIRESTGKRGYFLAGRLFENPEINIMADSLRASSFLTEQKRARLLCKLEKLASPSLRGRFSERVFHFSAPKSDNGNVLYMVDALSQAIASRKAVSFFHYRLDYHKRREFTNGDQAFIVFPEALLWHDGHYYLIAANENWDHLHFRIDRITDIRVLDSMIRNDKLYNSDELKNYIRSTFGPEAGKPIPITLLCEKSCSDEVFERFGLNIAIYGITGNHFKADVSAAPGALFYGWVFSQNGNVRILSPESVRKQMYLFSLKCAENHSP